MTGTGTTRVVVRNDDVRIAGLGRGHEAQLASILATCSLLLWKRQRGVTSSRVPSGQTATALSCTVSPALLNTISLGRHFQADELLDILGRVELRTRFDPAAEQALYSQLSFL